MQNNNLLCNRKAKSAALWFLFCICPSVVPCKQFGLLCRLYTNAIVTNSNTNAFLLIFRNRYDYFCIWWVMNESIDYKVSYCAAE